MTKKIQLKEHDCWLTVQPFIVYGNAPIDTGEFVVFFSFQEPGLLYGMQVLGTDGTPKRFSSEEQAFEAGQQVATRYIR